MKSHSLLLVIIDGMSWPVVTRAIESGRLPALKRLAEAGVAVPCESIFPSITPAATASLITGQPPKRHGVEGAFWYDRHRDEVNYFGDAPRVVMREGLGDYFDDFLLTLNDELLQTPTLYELADDKQLSSACLNLMWRRGRRIRKVNSPLLFQLMPGITLADEVSGPDWLFQGEFVTAELPGVEPPQCPAGPQHRFGFNDKATLAQLKALISSDAHPDVTVAYFPDNDFASHNLGAEAALENVEAADAGLAEIAKEHGGLDAWLDSTTILVVGDHGHSPLVDEQSLRAIKLDKLLNSHRFPLPGAARSGEHDLLICPNMRAAQIAFRPGEAGRASEVVEELLADDRIDQAIWHDADRGVFVVQTADKGRLEFCELPSPEAPELPCDPRQADELDLADDRGRRWRCRGDLRAVSATTDDQGHIAYDEYPSALARIADGGPACQPALWATARPGYEFTMPGVSLHSASSHGALHRSDTETVLIASGLPAGVSLPPRPSITDVAGLGLKSFGIGSSAINRAPTGAAV